MKIAAAAFVVSKASGPQEVKLVLCFQDCGRGSWLLISGADGVDIMIGHSDSSCCCCCCCCCLSKNGWSIGRCLLLWLLLWLLLLRLLLWLEMTLAHAHKHTRGKEHHSASTKDEHTLRFAIVAREKPNQILRGAGPIYLSNNTTKCSG